MTYESNMPTDPESRVFDMMNEATDQLRAEQFPAASVYAQFAQIEALIGVMHGVRDMVASMNAPEEPTDTPEVHVPVHNPPALYDYLDNEVMEGIRQGLFVPVTREAFERLKRMDQWSSQAAAQDTWAEASAKAKGEQLDADAQRTASEDSGPAREREIQWVKRMANQQRAEREGKGAVDFPEDDHPHPGTTARRIQSPVESDDWGWQARCPNGWAGVVFPDTEFGMRQAAQEAWDHRFEPCQGGFEKG